MHAEQHLRLCCQSAGRSSSSRWNVRRVATRRILCRHERRLHRPGVLEVGVDRCAMSLSIPVAWHFELQTRRTKVLQLLTLLMIHAATQPKKTPACIAPWTSHRRHNRLLESPLKRLLAYRTGETANCYHSVASPCYRRFADPAGNVLLLHLWTCAIAVARVMCAD